MLFKHRGKKVGKWFSFSLSYPFHFISVNPWTKQSLVWTVWSLMSLQCISFMVWNQKQFFWSCWTKQSLVWILWNLLSLQCVCFMVWNWKQFFWSCYSSVHVPSVSWRRGGTRRTRRAQSCNLWLQPPWKKLTSRELPPSSLCLLPP